MEPTLTRIIQTYTQVTFEECQLAYREHMMLALDTVRKTSGGGVHRAVFSLDSDEHCTTVGQMRTLSTTAADTLRLAQVYDLDDWLLRGGNQLNSWVLMHLNEEGIERDLHAADNFEGGS
jgi:hypothetical protein